LYFTLSRYYGDSARAVIPAIYWAFVQIGSTDLCVLSVTAEGVISSRDQLGFAFPVIAALANGGARVVYAFSGQGNLPNNLGPAYPGALTPKFFGAIIGTEVGQTTVRNQSMLWHGEAYLGLCGAAMMGDMTTHVVDDTFVPNNARVCVPVRMCAAVV
jgi:hypothetical protein